MGVLGEAQGAIAVAEEQGQQAVTDARSQAIDKIMADLSPVLAKPEYIGNIDTALVHYMGERAFTDNEATEKYTSLAERIKGESGKIVPVMFIYADRDEEGHPGASRTALTYIPRSRGVRFTSETRREEGVRIGLSGNLAKDPATGEEKWQPTTTTITHRRLSLKGLTTTFDGDALRDDAVHLRDHVIPDMFVLQERHVADDNYGKGMPSDYRWTDYAIDRLDEDPTVLVGWKEIEDALMNKFGTATNSTLQEARKIEALFTTPVSPLSTTMDERAPRLAGAMQLAWDFEQAAGKLATASE